MTTTIKKNADLFSRIKSRVSCPRLKEAYRSSSTDFSRDRKLPFDKLIYFMMVSSKRSVQIDLTRFIGRLVEGICDVTKSAFGQRRKKLKSAVFTDLLHGLNDDFYSDNEARVRLWKGKRLLAVDGSIFTLPKRADLLEIYGGQGNQYTEEVVNARASVLYDVLNDLVIDGALVPYSVQEQTLAMEHLEFTTTEDLLIFDRGYPSFSLMSAIVGRGSDYLMRCRSNFNTPIKKFIASESISEVVEFTPGKNTRIAKKLGRDTSLPVRMIKVILDDGEVETLLTSLLDTERYPDELFKELYFKRWGVERFFDNVKNIARVEEFSGHTDHVIQQDFHCALFMCNIHSLLISEAEDELPQKESRKYDRKINLTVSFGIMKDKLIELLTSDQDTDILEGLKELFMSHTVPIRPNRSNPRSPNRYRKKPRPRYLQNSKRAI